MAITKEKKVSLVHDATQKLQDAASVVFVGFKKLPVKETIQLRRSLKSEGVGFTVLKKTLLKRVLQSKNIDGEYPELSGEVAIAYSSDLLSPARLVHEFGKTHKDQVAILGGVFEGKYMDQNNMISIATIPGREVLLSQIAYLLKSPMQRLAIGVSEVAKIKV
jgi:large subunit ribosomal protein L10